MKAKDHFIDWLREEILGNPQEPPAGTWEVISDELDLEESWEEIGEELEINTIWDKIDSRLDRYQQVLRFERLGHAFSLAVVLSLLLGRVITGSLLPANSSPVSQNSAARQSEVLADRAKVNFPDQSATQPPSAQGTPTPVQDGNSYFSASKKSEKASRLEGKVENKEEAQSTSQAGEEVLFREKFPLAGSRPFINYTTDTVQAVWFSVDSLLGPEIIVQAERDIAKLYPSVYIGGGTALKVSWLLNNKTLYAMERSSLVTAAPAYQSDWFLLYGVKLQERLFLQGDLYVRDVVGQEYKEYRNGQYGVVKEQLNYQSIGLSITQVRKQLGFGKNPTFLRILGGIYGGRLRNAKEESLVGSVDKTGEYAQIHLGAMSGYEYDTFLGEHFVLSYGLRGRLDIMNIYSGVGVNPAAFRKTRAFSMDFSLSVRYMLKK